MKSTSASTVIALLLGVYSTGIAQTSVGELLLNTTDASLQKARAYFNTGQYIQAIRDADYVLSFRSGHAEATVIKVRSLLALGRREEALNLIQKYDKSTTALDARGQILEQISEDLLRSADACLSNGSYEQAIIDADCILTLGPNHKRAIEIKVKALTALRREDEASKVIQEAESMTAQAGTGDVYPEALYQTTTTGVGASETDPKAAYTEDRMNVPVGCKPKPGTMVECYTNTGWAKEIIHDKTGIELVFVPEGGDIKPFYIGKVEVTVEQYRKFKASHSNETLPSLKGYPATHVAWKDANAFCEWAGLKLPSEEEWIHACKGGTDTRFYWGDDSTLMVDYEWCEENSGGTAHPVGLKKANPWGLMDVLGNVSEWCASRRNDIYSIDGRSQPVPVLRGSTYRKSRDWCIPEATVATSPPGCAGSETGFRVALGLSLDRNAKANNQTSAKLAYYDLGEKLDERGIQGIDRIEFLETFVEEWNGTGAAQQAREEIVRLKRQDETEREDRARRKAEEEKNNLDAAIRAIDRNVQRDIKYRRENLNRGGLYKMPKGRK